MSIDEDLRYPLRWPGSAGDRTPEEDREEARFKLNLASAAKDLLNELRLMGAAHAIISCNVRPRNKSGNLPSQSPRSLPDPGAAVYFMINRETHEIGCDCWDLVEDNIRGLGKTIAAMRGIDRWGSSQAMKQALGAFKQLPPAASDWRSVLGLTRAEPTIEVVTARFRQLARGAHPDHGGREADMVKLNEALAAAKVELGA